MKKTVKRTPTTVRLPNTLYDRLKEVALREHRSLSSLIEMAVISFLGEEPNETTKAAIEEARSGKLEPIELDLTSVESMLNFL